MRVVVVEARLEHAAWLITKNAPKMMSIEKYTETRLGLVASCSWYITSVQPSSVMHWKMVRNACGIELNVVIPKLKSSEYVSNSIVFFASSARPPAPGM